MSRGQLAMLMLGLSLLSRALTAAEVNASLAVTGALSPSAIAKVIAADTKTDRCFADRAKAKPGLSGTLVLEWTIGADGTVASVTIDKAASSLDDGSLAACVSAAVKTWKFDKPTDGTKVSVTYHFSFGAPVPKTASTRAPAVNKEAAKGKKDAGRSEGELAFDMAPSAAPPAPAAEMSGPSGGAFAGTGHAAAKPAPAPALEPKALPPAKRKKAAPGDKTGALADEDSVMSAPSAGRAVSAPALKAGRYDDNKQYNRFLSFLGENRSYATFPINVSERLVVHAVDTNGKSLNNCGVEVKDGAGKTLVSSTTYADGTTHFFPGDIAVPATKDFVAKVTCGELTRTAQIRRDGQRATDVRFDFARAVPAHVPVDIAILIDTTGSMQNQIDRLKQTLAAIHFALTQLPAKPDIRFGLVAYRDKGDDYITSVTAFTADVDAYQKALNKLEADGGGDTPEDMQAALEKGMHELTWRKDALRLGFVISDAAPHTDYKDEKYTYREAMRDALGRGIKWVMVGAGGLGIDGETIYRQIAQFTMAEYVFITQGAGGDSEGGAGEASHHVGANYATENLDQAIVRIVRRELSYLTDEPKDFDYTIVASGPKTAPRDEVLAPAVVEVLRQLVDYSSLKLEPKVPVAVIPVTAADKKYDDVAGYLTDQFVITTTRNPLFRVVERDLKALAQEQKLQLSDLFDVQQSVAFGKLIGADTLIVVKLTTSGDGADIYAKLVRVETGEVLSAARVRVTGGIITGT